MSFGSPAADYVENKLDLNRFLVSHPVSTYFVRMDNDRLFREGIRRGDILVVDRSLTPAPRQLVVVQSDSGFKACRFQPGTPDSLPLFIWGVVTSVIRKQP